MTSVDSISHIQYVAWKLVGGLWPLVLLLGLVLCVWTYRRCRKPGYLIVAAYFLLGLCQVLIGSAINRTIRDYQHAKEPDYVLSSEDQKRYVQELDALNEKYFPYTKARLAQANLRFPFGPIILVVGLWFVARRESKRITELDGAGNSHRAGQ